MVTYSDNEVLDIYKEVLKGSRRNFPSGFWGEEGTYLKHATICIQYLIEDILNLNEQAVASTFKREHLKQYHLTGYTRARKPKLYEVINLIYPNVKPWQLSQVHADYWNLQTAKQACDWLFNEKLHWNKEMIIEKVCFNTFAENDLRGMIVTLFDGSPYRLIETLYPKVFEMYLLNITPRRFWTNEKGREALKWLIEEKLQLSPNEPIRLTRRDFIQYHLSGMLTRCFNDNILLAIEDTYNKTENVS